MAEEKQDQNAEQEEDEMVDLESVSQDLEMKEGGNSPRMDAEPAESSAGVVEDIALEEGVFASDDAIMESGLEGEGVATIIDPADAEIIPDVDPIVTLDQDRMLGDLAYQKQRPILLFQVIFVYALIFLKYGSSFTRIKFKGFQVKLFGSLLICQSLLAHQKT